MNRWYSHGWNTSTSLRLILTIVPRLPRWLVPPIGAITTAICLVAMKRERRAVARNLERILGIDGRKLKRTVWRLFYNYARFMVSLCDLPGMTMESLLARLTIEPAGDRRFRAALDGGEGMVVLTAHIGNWEIGARALQLFGRPVQLAMRPEQHNVPARWLNRLRTAAGIRVLPIGKDPSSAVALRTALARNEIVAMQGDRWDGGREIPIDLFGAPYRFPLGPFLLAYSCHAPLIPCFVVQSGWWRWSCTIGEAVRFPRTDDRQEDLRAGAAQYAAQLEEAVRSHPDQWFNFYDLWPDGRIDPPEP